MDLDPKTKPSLRAIHTGLVGASLLSLASNLILTLMPDLSVWPKPITDLIMLIAVFWPWCGFAGVFLLVVGVVAVLLMCRLRVSHDYRRRRWMLLIGIGLMVAAYLIWALFLARSESFWRSNAIYHPGRYMYVLHDWLDRMYPVASGQIKIHGEIFRMQTMFGTAVCLALIVLLFPIHRLIQTIELPEPRYCSKCGYDLKGTRDAGRQACPECENPAS